MHLGAFALLWFPVGFVTLLAACSLVFINRYRHFMEGVRDRRAQKACYEMAVAVSASTDGPMQVKITSVVSEKSAVLIGYYRSENYDEDFSVPYKERSTLLAWLPKGETFTLATLARWSAENIQIMMNLNTSEKLLQLQGQSIDDTVVLALMPAP